MTIRLSPRILPALTILVLFIIAGGLGYKYFLVSQELSSLKTDPTKLSTLLEAENKKLLENLGRLMQLPDETPRVVTITDKSTIASEPLLAKAETGDAFIIYSAAKKAIIYRPSQNKIIDVIPITVPSPSTSPSNSPTPSPTITPRVTLAPTSIPQ